jgi:hypothetical protein
MNASIILCSARNIGIAYSRKLDDGDRIHEDHEAVGKIVGKIKEWLDAQANAGRFGELSDEDMLIQVEKYIPQYLS